MENYKFNWKRVLITAIIIFGAMMISKHAFAQSVQLTWTPTTTNCDLSVADDISGYVVLWGDSQGGPYTNEQVISTPSTSTVVDVGRQEGSTLYFVSVSYDINGNRSDDPDGCGYSNEVSVNFPMVAPSPPTLQSAVVQ